MRVVCPECGKPSTAKANARRLKCPSCNFRQETPEGGLLAATPAWRKANPKTFTPEGGWPASDAPSRRTTAIVVGAIAALALAGIAAYFLLGDRGGDAPTASTEVTPAELDFITPGAWNVTAATDSIMAWVHNKDDQPLEYTWSLTLPGGQPLPPGWTVTFDPPGGTLAPMVADPKAQAGSQFPDWARTMVSISFPGGHPTGPVPVELRAGNASRFATINVHSVDGTVSQAGQSWLSHYDLRHSDGSEVQVGDFCVRLGAGTNAVPGYGFGAIGLARNETVTLVVPPPFAYGYGTHDLANDTLRWTTTLTEPRQAC